MKFFSKKEKLNTVYSPASNHQSDSGNLSQHKTELTPGEENCIAGNGESTLPISENTLDTSTSITTSENFVEEKDKGKLTADKQDCPSSDEESVISLDKTAKARFKTIILAHVLKKSRFIERSDPQKDIQELVQNMQDLGLQRPIGVYEVTKECYELIYGSRRAEAARTLGLEKIPAYVYSQENSFNYLKQINLADNEQKNISQKDRLAYKVELAEKFSFEEISEWYGQSIQTTRQDIATYQRAEEEALLTFFLENKVQWHHLIQLYKPASITSETRENLLQECLDHHWSVRQLKEAIREKLGEKRIPKKLHKTLLKSLTKFSQRVEELGEEAKAKFYRSKEFQELIEKSPISIVIDERAEVCSQT